MKTKLTELLGSIRFWIVTFTMISAELSLIASGGSVVEMLDAFTLYLGVVAGIGTLDSVATKISSK